MAVKDDSIFCTQQFEVCFSFYFNFSGESFINKIVKITFYGNLTVNQRKETKHLREKLVTLRNYIADKCIWQSGPSMWLKDSECQQQHCCSVFVCLLGWCGPDVHMCLWTSVNAAVGALFLNLSWPTHSHVNEHE